MLFYRGMTCENVTIKGTRGHRSYSVRHFAKSPAARAAPAPVPFRRRRSAFRLIVMNAHRAVRF
jgi:hypothetical protein